jgi:hypothetical protein
MSVRLGPVFVAAHPYTYGDRKHEEPWKDAVASELEKHWRGPYLQTPVRLTINFKLQRDYDLTGLLESTVNAIAHVVFPPSRRGHQTKWNHDDNWVFEIRASKELGQHVSPGAEILLEELE